MTFRERDGLINRIRQVRRLSPAASESAMPSTGPGEKGELPALEARIAHLERQLDGLQDSVHRESARHNKLIAELQAQIQPAAMNAALSEDARSRGL